MATAEVTPDGLTDRQSRFIDEYFRCHMNAVQAAIAVGYKDGPGIRVTASRLLHNPKVNEEVVRRLREIQMGPDELKTIIAEDARGLFGRYIRGSGEAAGELDLGAMEEDGVLGLIEQIVPTKYGTSYKGPSRQRAQAMLIKIMGLDKTQHIVSGGITVTHSLDERLEQIANILGGAGGREATPDQD